MSSSHDKPSGSPRPLLRPHPLPSSFALTLDGSESDSGESGLDIDIDVDLPAEESARARPTPRAPSPSPSASLTSPRARYQPAHQPAPPPVRGAPRAAAPTPPSAEQEDLTAIFAAQSPLDFGVELGEQDVPQTQLADHFDPWADLDQNLDPFEQELDAILADPPQVQPRPPAPRLPSVPLASPSPHSAATHPSPFAHQAATKIRPDLASAPTPPVEEDLEEGLGDYGKELLALKGFGYDDLEEYEPHPDDLEISLPGEEDEAFAPPPSRTTREMPQVSELTWAQHSQQLQEERALLEEPDPSDTDTFHPTPPVQNQEPAIQAPSSAQAKQTPDEAPLGERGLAERVAFPTPIPKAAPVFSAAPPSPLPSVLSAHASAASPQGRLPDRPSSSPRPSSDPRANFVAQKTPRPMPAAGATGAADSAPPSALSRPAEPEPSPPDADEESGGFGILRRQGTRPRRRPERSRTSSVPNRPALLEEDSLQQNIQSKLDRAQVLRRGGLHDEAHELLMEAQALDPSHSQVRHLLVLNQEERAARTVERLGDLTQIPRLAVRPQELVRRELDSRLGYLVTLIDGSCSFQDILEISPMPTDETAELLYYLLKQGILSTSKR